MKKVFLAGGCFWGVQAAFDLLIGVGQTASGYCAGHLENPTYEEVCQKTSGHTEAVEVYYDENIIQLDNVLDLFFKIHDPYQVGGQGNDIGPQYRSGIYWEKGDFLLQKEIEQYFEKNKELKSKMTTELKQIKSFWTAEEYHQKYLDKNPLGYCHINLFEVKNYLLIKGFLKK